MQKINKQLKTNLKNHKIEDKVKQYQVLQAWEKIVGSFFPNAVGKTVAVSLERGVLKIASLSRELATEIKMYAARLIDALNQIVGKQLVYAISCEC